MEEIRVNFSDSRDDGLRKLANLLDPMFIDEFVRRVQDSGEKRSIQELVRAFLEGE